MVAVEDESDSSDLDLAQLQRWAEEVLALEGYPNTAELALVLVDDEAMAKLNMSALGREGPTDVLSFPIEELTPGRVPLQNGPPLVVGDVYLAPAYIRRQALELGSPEFDEFALMVTHGILHCLGYDHVADDGAAIMETREREILGSWGMNRR